MLKFAGPQKNGRRLIGFGLDAENVARLRSGQPIFVALEELGLPGVDVTIIYGEDIDRLAAALKANGTEIEDRRP